MVITQKYKNDKIVYKASLVARRFEGDNLKKIRKDSPTCCKDNFRLGLCIISSKSWTIHSVDVKIINRGQGKVINRDIYLKPPKEAETLKLWTLRTTVYGLCDAPRVWYLSVKEVLWFMHCEGIDSVSNRRVIVSKNVIVDHKCNRKIGTYCPEFRSVPGVIA